MSIWLSFRYADREYDEDESDDVCEQAMLLVDPGEEYLPERGLSPFIREYLERDPVPVDGDSAPRGFLGRLFGKRSSSPPAMVSDAYWEEGSSPFEPQQLLLWVQRWQQALKSSGGEAMIGAVGVDETTTRYLLESLSAYEAFAKDAMRQQRPIQMRVL